MHPQARLQATLEEWTAQSQSGNGLSPSSLRLCGPTMDQIETVTEVRALPKQSTSNISLPELLNP